jgi:hypothetical protein
MVPCVAEGSDHFGPWLGLIGVVVGLVVSEVFAARREAVKRKHETETRFHDERLAAYIEFIGRTDSLLAHATVWTKTIGTGPFLDYAVRVQALGPYNESYARVRMLAKAPLTKELLHVHSYVQQLVAHEALSLLVPSFAEQIVAGANRARDAFETAAKEELGIA